MTKKTSEKTNNKHRILTPEEQNLWNHVVKDVRAFRPHVRQHVRQHVHDSGYVRKTPKYNRPETPDVAVDSAWRFEKSTKTMEKHSKTGRYTERREKNTRPVVRRNKQLDVDKRTIEKLKKGKMPPEDQLDLHGMTQDQARKALMHFISRMYRLEKRCILVITGKGSARPGTPGVLRRMVPHWLNEAPLCDQILAFVNARQEHGGEGAIYILLKRHRRFKKPQTP